MDARLRQYSFKERFGCLIFDIPRTAPKLFKKNGWIEICNRADIPERNLCGPGVRCGGRWVSSLHACNVFPYIGKLLLKKAVAGQPFAFRNRTDEVSKPDVTFLLPFRGADRLPLLGLTVQSILGQTDISVECIVIEQSRERLAVDLPNGVRHIHLPHPADHKSWRKSWAFNVGAEEAKADIVVCHDADILVPMNYGKEILRHVGTGAESVHIQRFLFKLGSRDTEQLIKTGLITDAPPEDIWQNWQGGTLAIRKDAFRRIGGYDERFTGWGGEDNEFFDRCSVLRQYVFGYLPFIHMWHRPQEEKTTDARSKNIDILNRLLNIPPEDRIRNLFDSKQRV